MKKLITLVITLMTIVTLSASAQIPCGTLVNGYPVPKAYVKPTFYGDFTPCKNEKNVLYTIGNSDPSNTGPLQWTWCNGIPGAVPHTGFVPSEFRWNVDPNSGVKITDGVTTSNTAGLLYTTQRTVSVNYKTKNTYLGCYFKDSCGVWRELYGISVNLTCQAGNGGYAYVAPTPVDTGRSVINATVIHSTINMSFTMDSISGESKPYTNINLYEKVPTLSCASNFAVLFPDGWYQQTRQSPSPTLPFYVAYGWSYYFPNVYPLPTRVFRMMGSSASGAWSTLPFTIGTVVPSSVSYPALP